MAHNVFTVQFADGKQLFGISEDIGGWVCRQLFETVEEARNVPRYGEGVGFLEPATAKATQEAVVIPEWANAQDWPFKTRASRQAMWLTGPGDLDEIEAERPVDFGIYGADSLKEVHQVIPLDADSVNLECPLCGAVATHRAEQWPINTQGVFIHSPVATYGVTCHACSRDFLFRPLAE
ncbi:hypothetical protein [Pseudomonas syringae]|uniref:hypothetical protein n=1 Tax=Pseudomonas syringae TaxID=317 RepID=UPI00200A62FB|nr:hypothetical protein [Pseudomonas syringae]MCK9709839.1 hypothetical protein [Pseudomonas syringae pv. syringae]